jgi:hypothetical protein
MDAGPRSGYRAVELAQSEFIGAVRREQSQPYIRRELPVEREPGAAAA